MASSKRRRSDGLILAESSNILEGVKRTCVSKAAEGIQEVSKRRGVGMHLM
jgi:hypothetical protein